MMSHLAALDSCLSLRDEVVKEKEERISLLKRQIGSDRNQSEKMELYEALYNEYYTFQFDSAMAWVKRARSAADRAEEELYCQRFLINEAELLAIGGFYSQADHLVDSLSRAGLLPETEFLYNMTRFWIYNYWETFSLHTEFEEGYNQNKLYYLNKAIEKAPQGEPLTCYLEAEYAHYAHKSQKRAEQLYQKVLSRVSMDTRLYASAAYVLASIYKGQKKIKDYEKWLINAAISDQVCPLKENYALQELAMYLYEADPDHAERATRYIYISLHDAQFYNNRLRMLEISQKMPVIVSAYQHQISSQRNWLLGLLVGLSLVIVYGLLLMVYIRSQREEIKRKQQEVERQNVQLEESNDMLVKANRAIEGYMRLFMDITALYMNRISDYKSLVKRKVKLHQEADLLKIFSSEKLQTEENEQFLKRFDMAFTVMFPSFVKEYNQLLDGDGAMKNLPSGELNTELRIAALIRLGVTESAKIATLLSYSPQTIYNYRSQGKNKAKNKATFDADIAKLCRVDLYAHHLHRD